MPSTKRRSNVRDSLERRSASGGHKNTSSLVAAAAEIAAGRTGSDHETSREISTQTVEEDGEEGDDEVSDSSSDILILDSSGESEGHHAQVATRASKESDEIEISDHFRRNSMRLQKNKYRNSGPYENFVPPTPPTKPGSVSDSPLSSVSTPASSPRMAGNGIDRELEPASIKRLLAAGQTTNV